MDPILGYWELQLIDTLIVTCYLQEGSDYTFLVGEKEEPIYVHTAILKIRQVI